MNTIATRDANATRPIAGFFPKRTYAYIGLACFAFVSVVFWTRLFWRRPRYMLVLCAGSTAMTAGFVMRIILAGSPYSEGIYIIEDLFILLSPCLFLATDYVILHELALSLGDGVSSTCLFLPARRVVRLFIWSDVTTFLIQAAGGGMSAMKALATTGQRIALIGLVLQLVSFLFYTALLLTFGLRVRKRYPGIWGLSTADGRRDWRVLFFTAALTCVGITIRSIFRIAEFAEGYNGWIPTHEAYFYLFDSLPLIIAVGLYMFVWPPSYTHQEQGPLVSEAPSGGYQMGNVKEGQTGPGGDARL